MESNTFYDIYLEELKNLPQDFAFVNFLKVQEFLC